MPQYELNLNDYWRIIKKRRWVIFIIFLAVMVFSVAYTNSLVPAYRAFATVQWKERRALGDLLTELFTVSTGDPVKTQSSIITGLPILEKVIVEMGLVDKGANQAEITNRARVLQGQVLTEPIQETNIIRIYVTDRDYQAAAALANKIAEVYIEHNLIEKTKESRRLRKFIEKQLEKLSAKLKRLEGELVRFKEKLVPTGIGLSMQNKLAELESERQKLMQQYTPLHPDVKNINEQIKQVEIELGKLPKKELYYNSLMREIEINNKTYRDLRKELDRAKLTEAEKAEDVTIVDRAFPMNSPISPNKSLNYSLGAIIGLMLGLTGAFLVEQTDTSIGTIEEVESFIGLPILGVIPFSQVKKKKKFAFFAPHLTREKKLNVSRARLIINLAVDFSLIEAYRMLDTNIWMTFQEKKTGPKIIIISSTLPGEGKTLISSNLAITMANRGLRTLLIDADLRRPDTHHLFGLKRDPGLSELLSNGHKLKDVLKGFTDLFWGLKQEDSRSLKIQGMNNLEFITAGHLPQNPASLLGSQQLTMLIDELKEKFDIIIIDTPPILPVSDVSLISRKIGEVVLIYQIGKTSRSALQRAKKQLESAGAKLKGVVLNCLSPQAELSKSYYYYRKYYGKEEK